MFVWQRNLKIHHFSNGVANPDLGSIFKFTTVFLTIFLPIVLSYGSGNLAYQLPISKLETANADLIEAVAILKNEIYITSARFNSGSGWKSGNSINFQSVLSKTENGNLFFSIEFPDFDPYEIELYLYLNGTDFNRPQMIFLQSSSASIVQEINFDVTVDYYYKVISEDVRELPIYLPSIVGQMWDPVTAIDRHVQQDNRVDIKTVQKRLIPKMDLVDPTKININVDFSSMSSRDYFHPFSYQFYAFFVEYVFFATAIYCILTAIGDFIFEKSIFGSIKKIEIHN